MEMDADLTCYMLNKEAKKKEAKKKETKKKETKKQRKTKKETKRIKEVFV